MKRLREIGKSDKGARGVLIKRYEKYAPQDEVGEDAVEEGAEAGEPTAHASENPTIVMVDESTGNRYMRAVDEDCYPIITTIDVDWRGRDTSDTAIPTQKRRLISTELTNHTLLGCSHGRRWGYDGEMIEVRNSAALYTSGSGLAHKIDWDGNRIHAANTSSSALRIIYMSNNNLYSQNGLDSQTAPKSVPFSDKIINLYFK